MESEGLWPGLTARVVETPRLRTFVIEGGDPDGVPVLFIHGNVSANPFWEGTLAALPAGLRGIAPDLRGYGGSETKPVDATRGLRDFADDLWSLTETLGLGAAHLVGWSPRLSWSRPGRRAASAARKTRSARRSGPISPGRAAARRTRSTRGCSARGIARIAARSRRAP